MINNRRKWSFFQHKSKPTISDREVQYWKRSLEKILKIGMEFEFNLPEGSGNCKGNSTACPCLSMSTSDCWKECVNKPACLDKKSIYMCVNRVDTCEKGDCATCSLFKVVCNSIYCQNFQSVCITCSSFEVNCEGCPNRFDPKKNPSSIRGTVSKELSPNNCYGVITQTGVHSIKKDGSLLGDKGIEVITTGRRIDYWEFFKMADKIIKSTVEKGAYVNERCSIHMHMLASYYSKMVVPGSKPNGIPNFIKELEKPLPQIILANYHQLSRRYQNAMAWMFMGLDDPDKMTRWEKFRVSILDTSAVLRSMENVRDSVSHKAGGNKYGWNNYKFCEFNKEGDVDRLHIEMRGLDGILCPSAVAAFACMHYAMMIKAVEISKYGIVEVGSREWMEQAITLKEAILNNMKHYTDGDRFGDTRYVMKYQDIFTEEALDLIIQLKHILIDIGPAYQILESIAQRPIALRRCDGESWEHIEGNLAIEVSESNKLDIIINEYIDLRFVRHCANDKEWVFAVAEALRDDPEIDIVEESQSFEEYIEKYIEEKRNDGKLIWSDTIGAIVLLK